MFLQETFEKSSLKHDSSGQKTLCIVSYTRYDSNYVLVSPKKTNPHWFTILDEMLYK